MTHPIEFDTLQGKQYWRVSSEVPYYFNEADAIELVDYYNKLNNRAGWYYKIVYGPTMGDCSILIESPDIEQYDGSHIVGYLSD